MQTRNLLLLVVTCLLVACKENQNANEDPITPATTETVKPLSFKTQKHQWSAGDCDSPGQPCLKIDLSYPLAENGKEVVRNNINEDINDYLISTLDFESDDEDGSQNVQEAAQRFIQSYNEQIEDFPEAGNHWAIEIDGQHAIYKNVLVIRLLSYMNTGGAHPNVYQAFTNFDLATGEEIYYEDIVTDSIALKKLAEKHFYIARSESGGEVEKGDAFWGKPFYLPENFAITKNGIKLFYNNYEALAYVFGPTEFILPYDQLNGIIKLPE